VGCVFCFLRCTGCSMQQGAVGFAVHWRQALLSHGVGVGRVEQSAVLQQAPRQDTRCIGCTVELTKSMHADTQP
jgi:hypothetical protein